jgi:branched-chain amino acid transport system substrate-binding protein
MRSRLFVLGSIGVLACVFVAAGLSRGAERGGSPQQIHLLSINSLTGPVAFYGKGSISAQKLAIAAATRNGGFRDRCGNRYTVKLSTWDDGATAAQAVAGMRKATSDRSVLAVIGSLNDVSWLPEVPVAGSAKIPLVIPSDGSVVPEKKWNRYSFRIYAPFASTFKASLQVLRKRFRFQRVGVIYEVTNDAARADAELWRQYARSMGYQVVGFHSFQKGDTDWRSQLTALKGENPDLLVLNADDPSGMYKQAQELGLTPKARTYSGSATSATVNQWDLSGGLVNRAYFFAPAAIGAGVKYQKPGLVAAYKKANKELPAIWQLIGADAVNVILDAVRRSCTGTDREKLRNALGNTKRFPLAAQGFVTWRNPRTGDNLTPTGVVGAVTGRGKFNILGSA